METDVNAPHGGGGGGGGMRGGFGGGHGGGGGMRPGGGIMRPPSPVGIGGRGLPFVGPYHRRPLVRPYLYPWIPYYGGWYGGVWRYCSFPGCVNRASCVCPACGAFFCYVHCSHLMHTPGYYGQPIASSLTFDDVGVDVAHGTAHGDGAVMRLHAYLSYWDERKTAKAMPRFDDMASRKSAVWKDYFMSMYATPMPGLFWHPSIQQIIERKEDDERWYLATSAASKYVSHRSWCAIDGIDNELVDVSVMPAGEVSKYVGTVVILRGKYTCSVRSDGIATIRNVDGTDFLRKDIGIDVPSYRHTFVRSNNDRLIAVGASDGVFILSVDDNVTFSVVAQLPGGLDATFSGTTPIIVTTLFKIVYGSTTSAASLEAKPDDKIVGMHTLDNGTVVVGIQTATTFRVVAVPGVDATSTVVTTIDEHVDKDTRYIMSSIGSTILYATTVMAQKRIVVGTIETTSKSITLDGETNTVKKETPNSANVSAKHVEASGVSMVSTSCSSPVIGIFPIEKSIFVCTENGDVGVFQRYECTETFVPPAWRKTSKTDAFDFTAFFSPEHSLASCVCFALTSAGEVKIIGLAKKK